MPKPAPSSPIVFEGVSLYHGDGTLFEPNCKLDVAYVEGCADFLGQKQRIFVVPYDARLAGTLSVDELIELATAVIAPGTIIVLDDVEDTRVRTLKHKHLGNVSLMSREAARIAEAWVGV